VSQFGTNEAIRSGDSPADSGEFVAVLTLFCSGHKENKLQTATGLFFGDELANRFPLQNQT
jgi:hypothetical protein